MNTKSLNLQYQGYLNTPNMWFGNAVYNLQQLEIEAINTSNFNEFIASNLRLGKRVEQFVFHELKHVTYISILAENLQIQQEKHTLGEIDALLLIDNKPVHLEIVYKFYVYDDSVGNTELDHWIGPNRKDSLVEKLVKLKNKQLPLLYHSVTLKYLENYNLEVEQISQQVFFKAQLFVPYLSEKTNYEWVNKDCIIGFYVNKEELIHFKDCKFYIPSKVNWLVESYPQVPWLEYSLFLEKVISILDEQTSPLVWIKHPNGEINKVFIVWW
ncbi:DUF1853 family protein [Formosa maritima]|uniref:DUF1853 family protein n=1 Tax=Formosa maritima TaxID=2592046 RepID=A0A5D0GJB0_9FLAO|nr:DUF1853 family protein [Formosa maritima]TYA59023.1 DUF1853 family protein [Formosa maritima]